MQKGQGLKNQIFRKLVFSWIYFTLTIAVIASAVNLSFTLHDSTKVSRIKEELLSGPLKDKACRTSNEPDFLKSDLKSSQLRDIIKKAINCTCDNALNQKQLSLLTDKTFEEFKAAEGNPSKLKTQEAKNEVQESRELAKYFLFKESHADTPDIEVSGKGNTYFVQGTVDNINRAIKEGYSIVRFKNDKGEPLSYCQKAVDIFTEIKGINYKFTDYPEHEFEAEITGLWGDSDYSSWNSLLYSLYIMISALLNASTSYGLYRWIIWVIRKD